MGAPDPSRWLDGLAAAAGAPPQTSETQDMDARVAGIVTRSRRRRRQRHTVMAVTGLVASVVLLLMWRWELGPLGYETSDTHSPFQAPSSAVEQRSSRATTSRAPRLSSGRAGTNRSKASVQTETIETEIETEASAEVIPAPAPAPAPETEPPRRRSKAPRAAVVTAADLLARAHRARRDRDADAARAALLEVRRRFAAELAAEEATFLLGRVEHELAARPERALRWFETYVDEHPKGRFVAQARGRIVDYFDTHGTAEQAADAAREYLRHHKTGPYADRARRVLTSQQAATEVAPLDMRPDSSPPSSAG